MANKTRSAETKLIPRDEWRAYFDRFTRRYLARGEPDVATIEVVSPTLGDQFDVRAVPLLGLSYDPKSNLFMFELEGLEHLVFEPAEIWVIEGDDGFVSTMEVVRADGTQELVSMRKSGPLASRSETAAPSP